jgi:hypothetical protein
MVVPGNCDLSFLAICRKIPKYKTYIRIEYDVVAIADPRIALEFLVSTAQGYDLGGSFFGGGYGDEWKWWPSLAPPENVTLDLTKSTKRAFFPIMSISKTFISTYEAALAAGWKGHFEVLAPTIALLSKSTTVDFSLTQPKITRFPQFQVAAPEEVNAGICYYVHPVKSFTEYSKIIDV